MRLLLTLSSVTTSKHGAIAPRVCVCGAVEQSADTGQTYIRVIHKGVIMANMWTGIRSLIVSMSACTHVFLDTLVLALAYPIRFIVIAVAGTLCATQD